MVEPGRKVRVRYTGTLDDGSEFDNSGSRGEPVEFVVGSKTMLPAFERAVSEMEVGERRRIRIPAAQAFGLYDEALVEAVPLASIPHAEELSVGGSIAVSTPEGPVPIKVSRLEDGMVYLDCNHELAGEDLTFDIQLVSVEVESAIERELHPAGCACGCDKLKQSLGA